VRHGSPLTPRWTPRPELVPGAPADAVEAQRDELRSWLHDHVLQLLEFAAAGGYSDTPDADELRRIVRLAVDELRSFVDGVEPGCGPRDLGRALADAVRDAGVVSGEMSIRLVVGPAALSVPAQAADALAGAVREALVNAARHAGADSAVVRCSVSGDTLVIVVEDDGTGFDPASVRLGRGIRHSIGGRVERLGGSAFVESIPGAGTRVTLKLALAAEEVAA
jgi:signal transduction histidine kinase